MKNWKLSTLLNTPLGVVTVVGLLILTVEFLIMLVIVSMHNVILYDQVMEEIVAGIIDPILLTLIVSPALYFLVFRKIQEGEQRFRQINAAALNAIVIVNEQSRITDWNSAAQKMFQYRPEEAVGQQLHQLIAPSRFHADALRGFAHFEETGEGPVVGKVTEIAARRKDGSEFPVELSISAVKLQGRWHAIGVIRDITERKQAEEAIIKASEKFHSLLDSIPDTIFITGMDGRFLQVNRSACERLGYSQEELLQMGPADIDTPEYAAKVPERIKALQERGELIFESAHVRKDGVVIPIELSNRIVDYDGKPVIIGVARDITERKETEAAFHTLIGTATTNIGAVFFQESVSSLSTWLGVECVIIGELVDENRVRALAMQLDGKAIEHYEYALPGTPCNNVAHKGYCEYPEGVCQLFPSDKDLSDIGAEAYIGTPIRDKAGKTIGVLCAISRHKIVPPPMLKGVFEVIAARAGTEIERKQAEEALRNERDFAQSIITTAQSIILLLDTEGRIVSFNPYMEKLTGWRLEEVRGKDWFSTFLPERNREATRKLFQTSISGTQTRGNVDALLTHDGRELQIEWFDKELKDSEGKVTGLLAIGQDATERKQAEAKLAEHTEELRRWHDITMGREMRTLELKREINELLRQAGQPPRYLSVVEQPNAAAEGSLRSSG